MKILVCGDRRWNNKARIRQILSAYSNKDTLIHGGAQGADSLAGLVGKEKGMQVKEYPADWKKYGKAAGPIRNQLMLDQENPDIIIAFHNNLATSKGTKDMVNRAINAGKQVIVIEEEDF